ncbi:MAG: CRISPR-associated CARF protein Csx1 [Nitrososphaerota archaeon]|nr:CRISPR-associated CARF protein Csx1 [Nitrososphaerota archaeon]
MDSVLVATWGNPWAPGWREVEYLFDDDMMKSKSSLPLLLQRIEKVDGGLSKVLIVVLDTVVDSVMNSYEELLNYVEKKFLKFISEDLKLDTKNIEVIVAPGTGRFRIRGTPGYQVSEFNGELLDFYIYVLLKLSREFCPNDLVLHLDLTHGINYMPVLVYRAVKELLGILAMSKKVKLTVYNAEPFVGDVTKSLRIHIVENVSIAPAPCSEAIGYDMRFLKPSKLTTDLELTPEERRILNNEVNAYIKDLNRRELNAFLGAVLNGLPLALYSFYPDPQRLQEHLNFIENMYKKWIKIYVTDDGFKVVRRVSFRNNFATLVKCYFTSKVIGLTKKKEVSLKELHDLRKWFFSKTEKLNATISYDLSEIENLICIKSERSKTYKDKPSSWISLNEVFGEGEPDLVRFNDRNFLAHSGLERNVTYIKFVDGCGEDPKDSILLKYNENEEAREKILNASSKGLSKSCS